MRLADNSGGQVGASTTLAVNHWYRIEVRNFNTSTTVGFLVDGVTIVASTSANTAVYNQIAFGGNQGGSNTDTAGVFYFDDVAINDTTAGGTQTGYPGDGNIVHLQPNAAGDNNGFIVQVGGTVGATNNFTRVSEVSPDDVTTYNGDVTSGHIDDFNITDTPAAIKTIDTINVVMVGVRYRALVAASEAAFQVRIKKASGGTVASSTAITPNSTTWKTNTNAVPQLYPIIEYLNPDAAAWTKALLDTAQIGYNISTTNTNAADISTVWALVDYTNLVPTGFASWAAKPISQPYIGNDIIRV